MKKKQKKKEKPKTKEQIEKDWHTKISEIVGTFFHFKPAQWILVISSAIVAFFSLFRFFFAFLFPAVG